MIRELLRSDYFAADFEIAYAWYWRTAGESIARRYLEAVIRSVESLQRIPGQGRPRYFSHPELADIRSWRVAPPFDAHLVFYRCSENAVLLFRLLHGRRNLPSRLLEPPSAD
ncbi:plasmid stabilization system protein [Opitutaceae bacterium TAV1]|nr:plasmid stabilization system protein [Opitutaceae bacterium TAV1]